MAEIAADKGGTQSLTRQESADFAAVMQERPGIMRARRRPAAGKGKSVALPKFEKPQLATLVDHVPAGNEWMHEIKFDGYRALAAVSGDKVAIYTRSGLDWTDKFAPLAAKLRALDLPPSLIDGEIVAYGKDGNPDFSSLQSVLKRGRGAQSPWIYYPFTPSTC